MTYQPVLTDDGLEIRDKNGNAVWGPSETYSWPPSREMMDAVFDDANTSQSNKDVLRLLAGLIDISNETTADER